jgi:hypothetical protein
MFDCLLNCRHNVCAELRKVRVGEVLLAHRQPDLLTAFNSPLEFRIPWIDPALGREYGDFFELANSEFMYILEHCFRHVTV